MDDSKNQENLLGRIKSFAKNTVLMCQQVKINHINSNIVSQLLRSATSVGANYSEACETTSKRDFANKIMIAKREAKESVYWCELLMVAGSAHAIKLDGLLDEAKQLVKILGSIYDKSRS